MVVHVVFVAQGSKPWEHPGADALSAWLRTPRLLRNAGVIVGRYFCGSQTHMPRSAVSVPDLRGTCVEPVAPAPRHQATRYPPKGQAGQHPSNISAVPR